jgi:uncharacterized protein YebE (UPF0316 family)
MFKILIVFIIGLIEQVLYTAYLLAVDKRKTILSSILMLIYMILYLGIVAYALKDNNTVTLLIAYALACGCGNYITMKYEEKRK